jgi:hypothetical protein
MMHVAMALLTQHAPVGGGGVHVVAAQVVLGPLHWPPRAVHSASVLTSQRKPVAGKSTQHAPRGAHGPSAQVVPAPCHWPCADKHWTSVT